MLSPLMLLGMLGLAIPITIHLIQKQRLKPQSLATLQFLDREDVANAFAPVPRDLLQLILRLLLLLLLVLLLARLTIPAADNAPRTLILVLDQSMSMQQQAEENQSLYTGMKANVEELVQGMREGDRISIQLVGDRARGTDFLKDKTQLLDFLADADVTDSGALALMPTIRQSVNLLRSRQDVNPSVIVFSDNQELNYTSYRSENEQKQNEVFNQRLADSRVKLLFVAPQTIPGPNVSLEKAVFSSPETYLGSSAAMTVTARNHGEEAKTVRLMFHEGKTEGAVRELTLDPGETAQMDLIHSFENPVDIAARVTIDEDGLAGDNTFQVPMRMKERTQILLVAPPPDERKKGDTRTLYRGADLLTYALNPGEALGVGGGTYINVKKVTPNLLEKQSLPLSSLIILYGVSDLSEQSRNDLQTFVKNGGGLLLILSTELSPGSIRSGLADFLGGIQPGQLKGDDKVFALNRNETLLDDNVLFPLIQGEWGDLDSITINTYFGLDNTENAKILLRTETGDPLIVTTPLGKGQVMVQAFDCELSSSSLPRTAAFVSMYQVLTSLLTGDGARKEAETMRVGDVLRVETPEFRGLSGEITIEGPDTFTVPIEIGQESIRFDQAVKAGAYTFSHEMKKSGRKHWVTVNPVQGESELATMSPVAMEELFGETAQIIPFGEMGGQFENKREIIPLMTLLLFAAFTIEALFGAWNSRTRKHEEVTS